MTTRRAHSPADRGTPRHLALHDLAEALRQRFPEIQVSLDAAVEPAMGTSLLDVLLGNHRVAVEWSRQRGFGLSSRPDLGYGEGPDETFSSAPSAMQRVTELLLSRTNTAPRLPEDLSELRQRLGLSQVQLAKRMKVQQGAISKLERRPDVRLSTVRAYLKAMGGELEIQARFPKETVRLGRLTVRPKTKAKIRRTR